jgi:hypothetical protein
MPEDTPKSSPTYGVRDISRAIAGQDMLKRYRQRQAEESDYELKKRAAELYDKNLISKSTYEAFSGVTNPKTEGSEVSVSSKNAFKEAAKRHGMINPEDVAMSFDFVSNYMPHGMQKARNYLDDMRDAVGGVVATASQSPASFLDISPLLSWYKANYGKDLLQGYQSPQKLLTNLLPQMATTVMQGYQKQGAAEARLAEALLSDVSTTGQDITTATQSEKSVGVAKGGQNASRALGDELKRITIEEKLRKNKEVLFDEVQEQSYADIKSMQTILARHAPGTTPGLTTFDQRTGILYREGVMGFKNFFGKPPTAKEIQDVQDWKDLSSGITKMLAKMTKKWFGGHASDPDFMRIKESLNTGFKTGNDRSVRKNLQEFADWLRDKASERQSIAIPQIKDDPLVKDYVQRRFPPFQINTGITGEGLIDKKAGKTSPGTRPGSAGRGRPKVAPLEDDMSLDVE